MTQVIEKKPSTEFIKEYFQITDIWKRMCELHNDLFDLTGEEYSELLASDFDKIEEITMRKNEVIAEISRFEKLRAKVIESLVIKGASIERASDLVAHFSDCPPELEGKHLWRFNQLLVDIIGKIQDQNKRNQIFINKAIVSLREIREGAFGEEKHYVYNSKGSSRAISTNR